MEAVVLGSGESAIGAALLARKKEYKVFVSDNGKISDSTKQLFVEHNIRFEESGHDIDIIGKADVIIKSPGIPQKSPLIQQLIASGKEVIGEIEFGYRHMEGAIIGITGSNGKSTVTNMIYQVLLANGRNVCVGGNFGTSLCRILFEGIDYDYYVLELSSFQLEDIVEFKPMLSVILNISPDHLDRYEYDVQKYADAKFRIFANQQATDFVIYNSSDDMVANAVESATAKHIAVPFAQSKSRLASLLSVDSLPFAGEHNYFNALIALEVGKVLGIAELQIVEALVNYTSLPHRMEEVAVVNGVKYINDSKATNVDAVYYALGGLKGPLVWIVGGTDKGNDYSMLDTFVNAKVKCIICMGIDNEKLINYYGDWQIPVFDTHTFTEAMDLAVRQSSVGDTVVLSPACASFDLFSNYIDRGNTFKNYIYKLIYQ